jgi:UDP-N-acetylmuramoyl-L-alanyl-D-glutamate--2,6-diaminopimelate ligase
LALLRDILYKVGIRMVAGNTAIEVVDVQSDSRLVTPGCCFIAVRGTATDGHRYIDQAIRQGAGSVVCEDMPGGEYPEVTIVQVQDSAAAAGLIAHQFYGSPSKRLKLVGVTGTNGKTTIATLLFKLFTALDHRCGLLSTVQNQIGADILPATHTTPDPISLNALLKRMADEGCSHVFMECSSHAIHQQRISGLEFAGGIFSNITHDHLDYHKTFDAYIRAKKAFFDGLGSEAFAISNLDDKRGPVMLQNTAADKFYYSLRTLSDFKGRIISNSLTGLQMTINEQEVHFRLIGEFNAYNLLAVYAAAICLGEDRQDVLRELSALTGAEGRFDYIVSKKDRIIGIIDYAHTPDALLNVLATIKKLRQNQEQIITVVGCGGDRDRTKRPIMAQVACAHSDRTIFTSDNPRSEDPSEILKDMDAGIPLKARAKSLSIGDRREAIKTAISLARPEDIVLVAGKGHEKYQEIKGVKHPFDDRAVLEEIYGLLDK